MEEHHCTINIRYDLPKEVWNKLEQVYSQMPGWLSFGTEDKGHWYTLLV
ncbi:hypothetical protein [uncultured Aquimarina sp.]|nr:hypothetical protein [uncultured Aquimarina sp.]